MIYLYDRIVCKDLQESFNPMSSADSYVTFIDTENAIGLAAQIHDDKLKFPLVAVTRKTDTNIDRSRMNFTRAKLGVGAVMDERNNIYHEKAIPIDLRYVITVLTTNIADMDEIVRELLFKYSNMYFLTLKLPYEAERRIRFGVILDPDSSIDRSSGNSEYLSAGQLYQTLIPLKVDGAVLVHYTPVKLKRESHEVELVDPNFRTLYKVKET